MYCVGQCEHFGSKKNKTGLQPVSKPMEQIPGFFRKVFIQKKVQKCSFIRCSAVKKEKETPNENVFVKYKQKCFGAI